MNEIFVMILGSYIFWAFGSSIVYFTFADDDCAFSYYGLVTKYVYKNSKMNIVGCVIIASLYYIIYPIFVLRAIYMFVYWLLHIGRK